MGPVFVGAVEVETSPLLSWLVEYVETWPLLLLSPPLVAPVCVAIGPPLGPRVMVTVTVTGPLPLLLPLSEPWPLLELLPLLDALPL